MQTLPMNFYDEPIEVLFEIPPSLEKRPECPQKIIWRGQEFQIKEMLEEWFDYRRKGKMARNMSPKHTQSALIKGSWGVGRFYFRVVVESGRIFEIYYDRAPENADNRKGGWFILGERKPASNQE